MIVSVFCPWFVAQRDETQEHWLRFHSLFVFFYLVLLTVFTLCENRLIVFTAGCRKGCCGSFRPLLLELKSFPLSFQKRKWEAMMQAAFLNFLLSWKFCFCFKLKCDTLAWICHYSSFCHFMLCKNNYKVFFIIKSYNYYLSLTLLTCRAQCLYQEELGVFFPSQSQFYNLRKWLVREVP